MYMQYIISYMCVCVVLKRVSEVDSAWAIIKVDGCENKRQVSVMEGCTPCVHEMLYYFIHCTLNKWSLIPLHIYFSIIFVNTIISFLNSFLILFYQYYISCSCVWFIMIFKKVILKQNNGINKLKWNGSVRSVFVSDLINILIIMYSNIIIIYEILFVMIWYT